jgi:membrane protein YdbS with pleckstrin-like domain
MVHALMVLAAAAGEEESSKTAFYIAGSVLAVFAVLLAAVGIRQDNFAATSSAARGVMAACAVLVLAAMATAVITG